MRLRKLVVQSKHVSDSKLWYKKEVSCIVSRTQKHSDQVFYKIKTTINSVQELTGRFRSS